jgi:hypothetical protein
MNTLERLCDLAHVFERDKPLVHHKYRHFAVQAAPDVCGNLHAFLHRGFELALYLI